MSNAGDAPLPGVASVLPPRPLLALCLVLMGGLAWSVAVRDPPDAAIMEAGRWEGQSATFEGWATAVRPDAAGERVRLRLVDGGAAIDASLPAVVDLGEGDRVRMVGRVLRWQGTLRLDVEDPARVAVVAGPAPVAPGWPRLAAAPHEWEGRMLRLHGVVEDGILVGEGHSVRLGRGPWPSGSDAKATAPTEAASVEAVGLLSFDPSCLCHRLDAREVRPWTP